jgi:hypothetical protein
MNPDLDNEPVTDSDGKGGKLAWALSRTMMDVAMAKHDPLWRKCVGPINFKSPLANPGHGRRAARWKTRARLWREKAMRSGIPFHNKLPGSKLQVSGINRLEMHFAAQDKTHGLTR